MKYNVIFVISCFKLSTLVRSFWSIKTYIFNFLDSFLQTGNSLWHKWSTYFVYTLDDEISAFVSFIWVILNFVSNLIVIDFKYIKQNYGATGNESKKTLSSIILEPVKVTLPIPRSTITFNKPAALHLWQYNDA